MWKVALTLAVVALIVGCHNSDQAAGGGPSGSSGGSKLKIVFIPKSTGNTYFKNVITGFEEAAKESGDEFNSTGPEKAEATSQIPIIKEQIQRQVDVIALSPNSPDALNAVLDEAKAKGILVITVDADLDKNESHRDAAVLQTDFSKIGESQIELLGKEINYEGDIAILSATRDAPNQNAWIASMVEVLKQPKYAKMHLVDTVYGDDKAEKSTTEFDALITKYPNLRGVISPTTVGLAAAARALEVSGAFPGGPNAKGLGLVLTGLGMPNQMKHFVDGGVVQAFQLWTPHDMGYIAVMLADQIKSGKLKPAEGTKFTAGTFGERSFTKNNVVIAGPLVTFDKSNIAKYDF